MNTPSPRDFPHLAAPPMNAGQRSAVGPMHRRQTIRDLTILAVLGIAAVAASLAGCGRADGRTGEPPGQLYTVARVIDGDTILLLDASGAEERVRVQGIDTPETHSSSKLTRDDERSVLDRETIRQLGEAASDHAIQLLIEGSTVHVVSDSRDRYGRLVGYVEATDDFGQSFDFGGRMVADGYAHAYRRRRALPARADGLLPLPPARSPRHALRPLGRWLGRARPVIP